MGLVGTNKNGKKENLTKLTAALSLHPFFFFYLCHRNLSPRIKFTHASSLSLSALPAASSVSEAPSPHTVPFPSRTLQASSARPHPSPPPLARRGADPPGDLGSPVGARWSRCSRCNISSTAAAAPMRGTRRHSRRCSAAAAEGAWTG